MTVDTKKVVGRREIRLESYDDLLADAERLAGGDVETVGNWTLGQIFKHLAQAMDSSIDGMEMKIPKKGEAQFSPDPSISTQDALAALRAAIERCGREASRAEHPAFGKLTREEWDKMHLRHAELHMSFAVLR